MEQDKGNEAQIPGSKSWRIQAIYRKDQVDSFWDKTDEKTRKSDSPHALIICLRPSLNSAVYTKAQPHNSEEFRQKVHKRLSKAQIRYLTDCSEHELEVLLSLLLVVIRARNSSLMFVSLTTNIGCHK
jgi:hypothetical protein